MSTERMDNASTQRINNSSTQRLNDATYTVPQMPDAFISDASKQPKMSLQDSEDSGINLGEVFTSGQVVELNGKRYFIEDKISDASGEAVIYKVSQEENNYILKYYKPGYDLPAAVISAIKNNPKSRIVRTYDYGTHLNQSFEIQEYALGGTLEEFIKENGAINDLSKLRNIIGQIAEGLEQLHSELRIIYQDLKPENIYFRDKEKTLIVLADFGISNVMMPGKNESEVLANATKEYAAPELARIGDNTKVIVDPSIDYFALGITMMHLWLGAKPFQGLQESIRMRQVMNKDVIFPQNIQSDYKILIQGLIDPLPISRWGIGHVKKWMKGESLVSDYQKTMLKYDTIPFTESESFSSPEQLADLLEKYEERGVRFLYTGVITNWLSKANDIYNRSKISDIIDTLKEDTEKITGVKVAVYALNPDKPFVSHNRKKCLNYSEIATALMNESDYYMNALKNKKAFFYLYLLVTEGAKGPIIVDKFHKYFEEFSEKRALSLIYLKLQDDDGRSITVGSKTYNNIDEIAAEQDNTQIALIKSAIMEKDSLFNVWLADNSGGFMESADGFNDVPTKDRFYILEKFPFLSYKELVPNWNTNALIDLQIMTQQCPGRFDLFETYAKQGLPFDGQATNLDWQPTVLSYLSTFFYDIVADENTKLELVKFLIKHGAGVNECSGDGSLPLVTTIHKRNVPLVKLLLELGADPNKEEKYAPVFWALCQNQDGEDENVRFDLANLLLEHNAHVNVERGELTLLFLAITCDCPKKVPFIKRLLDAGVKVNITDDEGFTPLIYSINKYIQYTANSSKINELKIMEMLLIKKAKTEVLNKKGYWSPLMIAADADAGDVVKLLVKHGAKKDFSDASDEVAYVYAMKKNNNNIKQVLDPGITLKGKAAIFKIIGIMLAIFPLFWIFSTMDILAGIISSANFSYPVLIGVSVITSHLLAAYIMVIIFGPKQYLLKLKSIFYTKKTKLSFRYLIGIPVLFPLVIALLQYLARLLPNNVNEVLMIPTEFFTVFSSGLTIFISYLLYLAAIAAVMILFHIATNKFQRKMIIYKQYL